MTYQKGRLLGIADCLAAPDTRVNILNFAEVEENCEIEMIAGQGFQFHLLDGMNINFVKRDILYVSDLS